jgi:hypothetical protein
MSLCGPEMERGGDERGGGGRRQNGGGNGKGHYSLKGVAVNWGFEGPLPPHWEVGVHGGGGVCMSPYPPTPRPPHRIDHDLVKALGPLQRCVQVGLLTLVRPGA